MGKTLYLECASGISGDMTVAALLDLGVDEHVLKKTLYGLGLDGYEIQISHIKRAGLDVCDFAVVLDQEHENHDHDMKYLHGDTHLEHMVHHHEHRSLKDIYTIIEQGGLTGRAEKTAKRIFQILGDAEAKAHGTTPEQVHFHEAGAVDSVIDIVAAAVCLDYLDITEVIVEELYEGRGTVRCQHGILPVPVPAVVNIAEKYKLPLVITKTMGELVTPTGAAITAAIRTSGHLPNRFIVEKTGMGAGKRNYDRTGILRAMLIHPEEKADNRIQKDWILKLETNVDDCTGEMLGITMEKLLAAGAKDVSYTPVYMKKNRPAYQITVLCQEESSSRMEQILFEETTTIGIRKVRMERSVLPRRSEKKKTSLGEVWVKVCSLPSGERVYPEYEEAVRLGEKYGLSYYEVCRIIQSE